MLASVHPRHLRLDNSLAGAHLYKRRGIAGLGDYAGDWAAAFSAYGQTSPAAKAGFACPTDSPSQDTYSCPSGYTLTPVPASNGGGNKCVGASGNTPYFDCLNAANALDPGMNAQQWVAAGEPATYGGPPTVMSPAQTPAPSAPVSTPVSQPALQPTTQPVATPNVIAPASTPVPAMASPTVQSIVATNSAPAPATCTISLLPSTGLCDYYVYIGGAAALLALWYFTKGK
jgi:hypothetical protein